MLGSRGGGVEERAGGYCSKEVQSASLTHGHRDPGPSDTGQSILSSLYLQASFGLVLGQASWSQDGLCLCPR